MLLSHWDGTAWTISPAPIPSVLNLTRFPGVYEILSSVTCVNTSDCWAVGSYGDTELDPTLALNWNGSSWTQVVTPDAGGPLGFNGSDLNSVSCLSSSDCWAVGQSINGELQAFVLTGTGWQVANVPSQPGYQFGYPYGSLGGVSCAPGSGCVLVGDVETRSSTYMPVSLYGAGSNAPPYGVIPDGGNPVVDLQGGGGGADTSCTCSTGDPVNLADGDYFDTTTDLKIASAGVPVQFSRTYDALAAQAEAAAGASPGPIGYGWTDNLGMSVSESGGTATVTQPNGSQLDFNYYATGSPEPAGSGGATWCPSDASTNVWCPQSPRIIATLSGGSDGGLAGPWTFVDERNQTTESFDSSGDLQAITDAAGDSLQAATAYEGGPGQTPCPPGDTCTAWSSILAGQSTPIATLVEDFAGSQLNSVFDAAAPAQTVSFAYGGTGCPSEPGSRQELCSVTDPDSATTGYTYDTTAASPYNFDLATASPPASGEVVNTYATGQLTEQVISPTVNPQVEKFAYSPNPTVLDGTQTKVTDYPAGPSGPGSTTTYVFSNGVEVQKTSPSGVTTYTDPDPTTLMPLNTIAGSGAVTTDVYSNYANPLSGATQTVPPSQTANLVLQTDAVGNFDERPTTRRPTFRGAPSTPPTTPTGSGARRPRSRRFPLRESRSGTRSTPTMPGTTSSPPRTRWGTRRSTDTRPGEPR